LRRAIIGHSANFAKANHPASIIRGMTVTLTDGGVETWVICASNRGVNERASKAKLSGVALLVENF